MSLAERSRVPAFGSSGRVPHRRASHLSMSLLARRSAQSITCAGRQHAESSRCEPPGEAVDAAEFSLGRRTALCGCTAGFLASLYPQRSAEAYEDARDAFSISLPEGWSLKTASDQSPTGPTASRRTLVWLEDSDPSTYVTAVITNIGADYTSLGSFGTAEQFGINLVSSMDRSFLRRARFGKQPDNLQEAQLVNTKDSGNTYFVEYTIKRTEEDRRHLSSIIAIGNNGRFNRLYTITAQSPEDAYSRQKETLLKILDSFQAPPLRI